MLKFIGGLLKFILIFLLIAIIAITGTIIALSIHFSPKPAEFEFSSEVSNITSVEIVSVDMTNENYDKSSICAVEDIDAFVADLGALECTVGITMTSLTAIAEMESIEAFLVTYADGTTEVITAYGNVGPDFDIRNVMKNDVYMFDEAAFNALLAKYK